MCGIAGIVDLRRQREVDQTALQRMAHALEHRGPDDDGWATWTGLGLAARRLSIVGVEDSRQPIWNEDRTIVTVFNGELFDYVENRERLKRRGHTLRTSGDTETLVHLWEDYGEEMFSHLNGQFAFALFDRVRNVLLLARDRFGICPLHWSRSGDWLVFGSEMKSLLASGLVPAAADPRGLNHILTFFSLPAERTVFENISAVQPGCYLKIRFEAAGEVAKVTRHRYWDLEFPDAEDHADLSDARREQLIDELDAELRRAIRIRMRADVPVAAYLSGGVDSATILALSRAMDCQPAAAFTAQIADPKLNETHMARGIARREQLPHQLVPCGAARLSAVYPDVIRAADYPVMDSNTGALWSLSRAVHQQGLKVVLTGEGADEAMAGYVWFKVHKLACTLGWRRHRPVFDLFGLAFRLGFLRAPRDEFAKINQAIGGPHAQSLLYHLTSLARWRLLSPELHAELDGHRAYDELSLDTESMRRWHPLNQSLYFSYKTHLTGSQLNHRGDRAAMSNSVEVRYPFLDERVVALCGRLPPQWKLRGLREDKYLLRQLASRYLPRRVALRPKAMFRAPFKETFFPCAQPYVRQLLSPESLRRTPYFDARRVRKLYQKYQVRGLYQPPHHLFLEMALTTVLATQLWHHLYLGGGLCELPVWSAPAIEPIRPDAARVAPSPARRP